MIFFHLEELLIDLIKLTKHKEISGFFVLLYGERVPVAVYIIVLKHFFQFLFK